MTIWSEEKHSKDLNAAKVAETNKSYILLRSYLFQHQTMNERKDVVVFLQPKSDLVTLIQENNSFPAYRKSHL